jgi:hypothetical protein
VTCDEFRATHARGVAAAAAGKDPREVITNAEIAAGIVHCRGCAACAQYNLDVTDRETDKLGLPPALRALLTLESWLRAQRHVAQMKQDPEIEL